MSIRWITDFIGTAPAEEVSKRSDLKVVDVRDLVDKAGNRPDAVKEKIMIGVKHLRRGSRVVVCCDYGISRSNSIAAGIIAVHDQISFYDAVQLVQEKTGETEIKLAPLESVRRATEENTVNRRPEEKRTVLITGASGFIGTAVCKRLRPQFEVIAPTREQIDIELGSTKLNLLVARHHVESIIHLANPRVYTSNIALGKTLTMLRNVLEVCVAQDISLIYPSGWEIYSGYAGSLIADEALPALPRGPYGETKYLAELMIQQFQRTSAVRCALVRSSPVYGPSSDKPKFVYNFINKARNSELIVTHRYLNGDAALDLLHIDDFVDVIVRVFAKEYIGNINVGTGTTTSTHVIAQMLKTELGSSSSIEQVQIDSYNASIAMNYDKANILLGWSPKIKLEEGLKQLLTNDYCKGQLQHEC
ncbi:MAG: NAD-dependent epimerase/dehydratase family protein [Desulfobulbaceae bacterium]|nr:NAD-dependent epimerase/dehydratase family protein [Desulfobulbaceae bacterium]